MLSILFRILGLFLLLVWLFQRLRRYFPGAAKGSRAKNNPAESPNQMVKDPVCGMYMDSRLAVRLDGRNEEFYFCSQECKEKYLSKSSGSETSASR